LNGGIAQDAVSENDVAFDASDEHDSVCVAEDDVVDNDVVVGARRAKTDAEVAALSCVTIPTEPVRTEPVATRAARQSYAAARSGGISVAHGSVLLKVVVGRSALNDDPR
jgi:hypothetical protein